MPTFSGGGGGTFNGGTVPNATVFSSTVEIQSLGVGEAADGTTGDIVQTAALTTNTNAQVHSLGVGQAADGTAGNVAIAGSVATGGATPSATAGDLIVARGASSHVGQVQWGTNSQDPVAFSETDSNGQAALHFNAHAGNSTRLGNAYLQLISPQILANLPPAGASFLGAIAVCTDSHSVVWGATIVGGGANTVLAYCDGTNWTVLGI
jgi:hypothetical protein